MVKVKVKVPTGNIDKLGLSLNEKQSYNRVDYVSSSSPLSGIIHKDDFLTSIILGNGVVYSNFNPSQAKTILAESAKDPFRFLELHSTFHNKPRTTRMPVRTATSNQASSQASLKSFGPEILWCPGLDDEMRNIARRMTEQGLLPSGDNIIHNGGRDPNPQTLGNLELIPAKVYILAHINTAYNKFSTGVGMWSASELVEMLVADGLDTDVRQIELVVCLTGGSNLTLDELKYYDDLSTEAQALKLKLQEKEITQTEYEQLWQDIVERWEDATSTEAEFQPEQIFKERQVLINELNQLKVSYAMAKADGNGLASHSALLKIEEKMGTKLNELTKLEKSRNYPENQTVPLAATFVELMKKAGFNKLHVRSYAAEVSTTPNNGHLNLYQYIKDKETGEYRKITVNPTLKQWKFLVVDWN